MILVVMHAIKEIAICPCQVCLSYRQTDLAKYAFLVVIFDKGSSGDHRNTTVLQLGQKNNKAQNSFDINLYEFTEICIKMTGT